VAPITYLTHPCGQPRGHEEVRKALQQELTRRRGPVAPGRFRDGGYEPDLWMDVSGTESKLAVLYTETECTKRKRRQTRSQLLTQSNLSGHPAAGDLRSGRGVFPESQALKEFFYSFLL
jgi:hypothetical protein